MRIPNNAIVALSTQDVFDVIAWNLLRQNARAREVHGDRSYCRYRASDGRRCAIGFILPDEVYHHTLEGLAARDLAHQLINTNFGHDFAKLLYRDLDMLTALQKMHDRSPPAWWAVELSMIARRYGLSPLVVDQWCAQRVRDERASQAMLAKVINMGGRHGCEEREEACEVSAG